MLEREHEIIREVLAGRTIGERKSYHLEEALKADIPRGVKAYLQAEVERWLERDLRTSQTFARVDDQAAPYVDHVTATFLRAVSAAYCFTQEQFLNILESGIRFAENYLCRPRWTLENFLFDEKDVLLLHEFRSKLKYLADYRYFATVLERIARERQWSEVHGADIRPLIHRIDDEVVRRHGPGELPLLTKPIYEFLLLGEDPFSKPISIDPLLMFFQDKGLNPLGQYVEKICHIRQRTDLSLGELVAIVEDFYPPKPLEPEKRPSTPVQESLQASHNPPIETQPESIPSEGEDTFEPPIPKETPLVAEPEVPTTVDTESLHEAELPQVDDEPPALPPQQKRENAPLALTYAGLRHSDKPQSYPDLLGMVDEKKRQLFVKKLFANDDAYYTGVMTALNSLPSWKDASLYLSNFYDINGLDPYADEVIEFTDVVHQRFATASQRTA
jgi:hypothetical protein